MLPLRRDRPYMMAIVLLLLPAVAFAQEDGGGEAAVTPYRPTVSNPASLPHAGWVEGEFGALTTHAEDGSRSGTVPWLVKLALADDYGILVGGNAYASSSSADARTLRGIGDMTIEWKQAFAVSDHAAFGIEAGEVVPTARRNLGVGKPATVFNGIYSVDLGAIHVDVNLGGTRYTTHTPGVSRWQSAWAGAASWSLTANWGAALELSGTRQHGLPMQSQALTALNYNWSAHLVLDAGVACGLAHAAHDKSVFAGATVLLGRLR